MKKLFAFITVLALATASIFADVTVKDIGGGNAEVTFFYPNPRASEVLLAGSFTNWQDGALPMTKTDKGFEITKTFKATDEVVYKFISDGNWTTDLKAPEFMDDGFGGKNSKVTISDFLSGNADASKAKINFVSWSMIGVQANYRTQGAADASKKGFDLDSVNLGMKSYNKFVGNFLPGCPLYIEIALAETDLEDYSNEGKIKQIYAKNKAGVETISWEDGFKNLISGIFGDPVAYIARATMNNDATKEGPGTNPFLGHLKFGFSTPVLSYVTGFNYAKPDVRDAILWTTVASSWDAGYKHIGGFNQFTLGTLPTEAFKNLTGLDLDVGFAPNRTADRKGKKYGYWGWVGLGNESFKIDLQSNGMYNGLLFDTGVEHDFIAGGKMDAIAVGDGSLSWAAQALVSTHQADTAQINKWNADDGWNGNACDYFGYSTDVWYRTTDFGLKNIAAQAKVGYKMDGLNASVSYRMRGAMASMLYVRQNHDDGTFDLSNMLGRLNSQNIDLSVSGTLLDEQLTLGLDATVTMPLQSASSIRSIVEGADANTPSWYGTRCKNKYEPLFIENGAEFIIKPAVTFQPEYTEHVFGAYCDMYIKAYKLSDITMNNIYLSDKYACSDSPFAVKVAGVTYSYKFDSDILKQNNTYVGLDFSNADRYFFTAVEQLRFAGDWTANVALGLKTANPVSDAYAGDNAKLNNPFAFSVGVSKQFKALKKPVLYAQFSYNMDPFKHFGDGQDALNLNRANVNGSWEKEGVGTIDAVDWYDGRAAIRVGIRWDI